MCGLRLHSKLHWGVSRLFSIFSVGEVQSAQRQRLVSAGGSNVLQWGQGRQGRLTCVSLACKCPPGRLAETLGLKPVEKQMARGVQCPKISSKTTSSQYLGQLITPSCALTATSHRPPCFTGVWCAGSVTIVRPPALKCTALLKRLETHQKTRTATKKSALWSCPGQTQ